MLQQEEPDDYVLATGETHTVREFVEKSFAVVGTTIKWMGDAGTVDEYGVDADDESKVLVRIDPQYFRCDRSSTYQYHSFGRMNSIHNNSIVEHR